MTDFVPPPAPKPAIKRFGTSIVGTQFEWQGVTEDGSAVGEPITARAAAAIQFEDTLRYTTGRHAQLVQTQNSSKAMREKLDEINPTDSDYPEKFNALIEERLEFEQASWIAAVDTILLLVNEADRPKLRPALIKGDPRQVNELRSWLEQEVLATAETDAAVASQVDPTSPKPQQPSASNPASGGESDSKESSSTD